MTWHKSNLLIIFLFCLIGICHGENKSYSIRHYDLLITPDFKSKIVSLNATLEIDNPGLQDSLLFGLNDRYDSVIVTSNSYSRISERANGWVLITLVKPSKHDTLFFRVSGVLGKSDDEEREIVDDSSLFLLWSDRFYPMDFEHWATVKTEIVLPPDFQAIAPGKMTRAEKTTSGVEYVFETTRPTALFSVFADSRWIKMERTINGIPMQTLLYPAVQKYSDQIFRTSSEVLKFYAEAFCPYPFDQFSFVSLSGIYARRAFPGFVGYEPGNLEKEFSTTGFDAHETALLWWDCTIRGSGPGSFQWTEGFGDYAEILFDEEYHKPIPRIFERFRREYLALPAEKDVLYSDLQGNTPQELVHGKYPWMMHLVRYVVGDSAFRNAIKLVFEKFRFRTFTMDEFISTLEEGCGQSLRWWREEWLERKGVPDVTFQSSIRKNDSQYLITCTLAQRGNIYHLPLEIGIEAASGTRIEKVKMNNQHVMFTFKSNEKPTKVVLDPNRWVLMKVDVAE